MPKSIPLRPTLRIQGICIIIRNPRSSFFDRMLESLPSKCRRLRDVQWQTTIISMRNTHNTCVKLGKKDCSLQSNDFSGLDLPRGSLDSSRG